MISCNNLQDELAVQEGCYYDDSFPRKFKEFYEATCVLTETCHAGEVGTPLKMIPWQYEDIIRPMLGWRRKDNTKRYRQVGIWVPKKNNKSGLVSAIGLYHIACEEQAASALIIASKVEQSRIVFDFTANTLRYGPLKHHIGRNKKFWIRGANDREIIYTSTTGVTSKLKIMPFNPEGASGYSTSMCLWDEYAELPPHAAEVMWNLVSKSVAARNGTNITISTSHFDRTTLAFSKYQYAQQVLQNKLMDWTFLPVIFGVPDDATCICGKCEPTKLGWECPEQWWKANPSAGITVPKSYWEDNYQEAKNNPRAENAFRILNLGQWSGSADQWISPVAFNECKEMFDEKMLWGSEAWYGCDHARRGDLASYVIVVIKDGIYYFLPRGFLPGQLAAHKEKTDPGAQYTRWEKEGWIHFTDGDVIDPKTIRQHIAEDAEHFPPIQLSFDPYGFEETRQILEAELGIYCVEVAQTYGIMAPATARFERLVLDKAMRWNGNPVYEWCLNNCTVRTDQADRILIDKRKSKARVDMITASIIALTPILAEEADDGQPLAFLL